MGRELGESPDRLESLDPYTLQKTPATKRILAGKAIWRIRGQLRDVPHFQERPSGIAVSTALGLEWGRGPAGGR